MAYEFSTSRGFITSHMSFKIMADKDGKVSFEEFKKYFSEYDGPAEVSDEHLRKVFDRIDNTDGLSNGIISINDINGIPSKNIDFNILWGMSKDAIEKGFSFSELAVNPEQNWYRVYDSYSRGNWIKAEKSLDDLSEAIRSQGNKIRSQGNKNYGPGGSPATTTTMALKNDDISEGPSNFGANQTLSQVLLNLLGIE